jgi:hypothetical protein
MYIYNIMQKYNYNSDLFIIIAIFVLLFFITNIMIIICNSKTFITIYKTLLYNYI